MRKRLYRFLTYGDLTYGVAWVTACFVAGMFALVHALVFLLILVVWLWP